MELLHLRHTMRIPNRPHITKAGLKLAQTVGKTLGLFDVVFSSVSTRAVETTIALGFPINDTIDFSLTTKSITISPIELPESSLFTDYLDEYNKREYIYEFANNCKNIILEKLREFPLEEESRVLLVSHGGVLEASTIAFLPTTDFEKFEAQSKHCEGVQLTFDTDFHCLEATPFKLK